jgi:hypothetical protein
MRGRSITPVLCTAVTSMSKKVGVIFIGSTYGDDREGMGILRGAKSFPLAPQPRVAEQGTEQS